MLAARHASCHTTQAVLSLLFVISGFILLKKRVDAAASSLEGAAGGTGGRRGQVPPRSCTRSAQSMRTCPLFSIALTANERWTGQDLSVYFTGADVSDDTMIDTHKRRHRSTQQVRGNVVEQQDWGSMGSSRPGAAAKARGSNQGQA